MSSEILSSRKKVMPTTSARTPLWSGLLECTLFSPRPLSRRNRAEVFRILSFYTLFYSAEGRVPGGIRPLPHWFSVCLPPCLSLWISQTCFPLKTSLGPFEVERIVELAPFPRRASLMKTCSSPPSSYPSCADLLVDQATGKFSLSC